MSGIHFANDSHTTAACIRRGWGWGGWGRDKKQGDCQKCKKALLFKETESHFVAGISSKTTPVMFCHIFAAQYSQGYRDNSNGRHFRL